MKKISKREKIVEAINQHGCLLVYPIDNRQEPQSIWSVLYPRTTMRWEWDSGGDNRVGELWVLREQLMHSREVVYSKWFQGRATFFSKKLFVNLLAYFGTSQERRALPSNSREALDLLLMDSPQSTPVLKENLGLRGKLNESQYNRTLKPLWSYLYLVGFGEVEDSSFPSLNIGASATLFEDLWIDSKKISAEEAEKYLIKVLGVENPFLKFARKLSRAT